MTWNNFISKEFVDSQINNVLEKDLERLYFWNQKQTNNNGSRTEQLTLGEFEFTNIAEILKLALNTNQSIMYSQTTLWCHMRFQIIVIILEW